ncbi:NapC/NirT family cytochrome c [Gammaproteobacteria bacterium]|nr:NapC/NirT family cytochrome c [Gammaproteobacteria bacterium]
MLAAIKRWFYKPSRRFGVGAIFVTGFILGIVFWGGFNTYVEYTNTVEFCISCHEMRDTVYVEYKESKHYSNASGVRVSCADCHVPRSWGAKMVRKIRATNELYHKLIGSIDTKEKFNAKRLQLAENVWNTMESSDSRECRNCHDYEAMNFHDQSRRGAKKMKAAMDKGKTCIECHKGIAHKLPPEYEEDD